MFDAAFLYGGQCLVCRRQVPLLARALQVCPVCLKRFPGEAWPYVAAAHRLAREGYGLPGEAPQGTPGIRCTLCFHECLIPEGEQGYCGLRENQGGKLVVHVGIPGRGLLQWYFDPIPTNCVAGPVCPERNGSGRKNLAVFYGSCSFNCLFCQNWHYRKMKGQRSTTSAAELARVADTETACICFFGGDPSSQMPHALAAGRRLAAKGVRVCWETNGAMHPRLLEQAVRLSLASGGCVKFDLKAWDPYLHLALTGVGNRRTLENFRLAASYFPERPEPPLLVASTPLVPGYVDADEVYRIARFIAGCDPRIPYFLLGFAPQFHLGDLPPTSARHARQAGEAARAAGLHRVYLGNEHLFSRAY